MAATLLGSSVAQATDGAAVVKPAAGAGSPDATSKATAPAKPPEAATSKPAAPATPPKAAPAKPPVHPPDWERPHIILPIVKASRITTRRLLVRTLHEALAAHDYPLAARLNAGLAREANVRARRVLDAWKALRDPATGLVPKSPVPQMRFWNTRDVAGDLFPYLLYASHELDAAGASLWLDTMAFERARCGPMPCNLALPGGAPLEMKLPETLFGAVEYAKDGLLAVTERLGEGPWLDRMVEDIDAVLAASPIASSAGALVSDGTEVNGELLLVLSRLWQKTGNEKYIAAAERIAEAYLFEVMPKNHGLPARMWDFASSKPRTAEFRLRDHGSELFPGLGEFYLVEKLAGRPAAERYREPIRRFFDAVLALPRTPDGMFLDSYDAATGKPIDGDVTDTWGYLLTGLAAFDLAEGTRTYFAEIEHVMRGAATRRSFQWEWNYMDGYADSIESMLYHLPFHPIAACAEWVDDEIEVLFAKQQPNGFVERWYLDGNFIRTTMLYARYKTMGTHVEPWNPHLQLGAVVDPADGRLFVHVSSDAAWSGRLRFDVPRHALTWRYPVEFPRLNGLPEWFTVDPARTYTVTDLSTGAVSKHSGAALASGLPLTLPPDTPTRLTLTPEK